METKSGKRLTSGLEEVGALQEQNAKLAERLAEEAKSRQALEEELRRLRADQKKP